MTCLETGAGRVNVWRTGASNATFFQGICFVSPVRRGRSDTLYRPQVPNPTPVLHQLNGKIWVHEAEGAVTLYPVSHLRTYGSYLKRCFGDSCFEILVQEVGTGSTRVKILAYCLTRDQLSVRIICTAFTLASTILPSSHTAPMSLSLFGVCLS